MMWWLRLGCVLLMLGMWQITTAQSEVQTEFTADTAAPLIGQPIELILTVKVPAGATVTFPAFPADWSPFTVIDTQPVENFSSDGQLVYQQKLTVVLWRIDAYQTPETVVSVQLSASPEIVSVAVAPIFFQVQSVLTPDDLQLRPFTAPIDLPFLSPIMILISLVVLAGLAGGGVWFFRRQQIFARRQKVALDAMHPAARTALVEMETYGRQSNNSALVYAKTVESLRNYIQTRLAVTALDMTTEEVLTAVNHEGRLDERRLRELQHLLERADLVKFARVEPRLESARQFVRLGQRWVQTVETTSETEA